MFSRKIVSDYDREIPQSQTAGNPLAPRGRAAQPSRDTRKTNSRLQILKVSQNANTTITNCRQTMAWRGRDTQQSQDAKKTN